MPDGFKLVSEKKEIEKLKILIQGPISGGKSWLAASIGTSEKKARVFEFDGKAESFRKHLNAANIYVKSYIDKTAQQGSSVPEPRAAVEFINDIGMFEYEKTQGKYESCYNIIDSVTMLEMALVRMYMYQNSSARKQLKIGSTTINIPSGWDAQRDSVNTLTDGILNRLFALDDLILIAHERPEEDKTSDSKDKRERLTGKYSIHPPRLDIIKSLFNDKYRVLPREASNGDWKVQLETNGEFLGATTLFGVQATEVANLAELIRKHKAAIALGKG